MVTPAKFVQIACAAAPPDQQLDGDSVYALDEEGGVWFFDWLPREWRPMGNRRGEWD